MREEIKLTIREELFIFRESPLIFHERNLRHVFANKNNKSLKETVSHKRYVKFSSHIFLHYNEYRNESLGNFLFLLKKQSDLYYKRFLNKYGDEEYCRFSLGEKNHHFLKGLYLYYVNDNIKYIGRCLDNYAKRVNMGYGKIHPKNCYIDGQTTNCHLNSLINSSADVNTLRFFICPMEDIDKIKEIEVLLIQQYKPDWNLTLKTKK